MNILLVEDARESRDSLSRFLRKLGHDVRTAEDGEVGWSMILDSAPHLVLTDIMMPRLDGHGLLQRIKENPATAGIAVILFSGFGDVNSAIRAMREGAHDYLLKPINVEELAVILERVEDYLDLRREHRELTTRFEERVDEETRGLHDRLEDMQRAFARALGTSRIAVFSSEMRELFNTARRLHAKPGLPALIVGETGTGKELIARFIHFGEGDTTSPFVALNCAAINPNIFESELFGYEAGAFTGGNPKGQAGKLEMADGGTLFLDEITEMSADLQAKLLRVIQEREFYRVGGIRTIQTNVRIIGATNRDLEQEVASGNFRRDLYYRLNVGLLHVPPLRDRAEEIAPFARMFLEEMQTEGRTRFREFSPEAMHVLEAYSWPGNVRELRNAVERVALLYDGTVVAPSHLSFLTSAAASQLNTGSLAAPPHLPKDRFDLDGHIHEIIRRALEKHKGNKSRTAEYLGITRSMLYTYLKNMK